MSKYYTIRMRGYLIDKMRMRELQGFCGQYDKKVAHNHAYSGDKWFKVNLALKIGEKVILLRCAGAQQYVILDRVDAPKKGAI